MNTNQNDWNQNGVLHIKESDRILVVAPHADDETIGCGGLLIKYASQTDVLLLSDGRLGYNNNDSNASQEQTRQFRTQEFKNVMEAMGIRKYTMLDLPDSNIYRYYSIVKQYDLREYDFIFVTSRFEKSQDHKHAFFFIRKMLKSQHAKARLIEYEVWVPIPDATLILDINDVIDQKGQLLSMYTSQLKCYDYVQFAYGLSLYRGGLFHRKNVEAFFVQPKHYHIKQIIRFLTTYSFRQKMKSFFPFLDTKD